MTHKNRDANRQRNTAFPDTAANEARFRRNVITGKRKLSGLQSLGIVAMALIVLGALVGLISTQL